MDPDSNLSKPCQWWPRSHNRKREYKPAVKNFIDSSKNPLALFRGYRDKIDFVAVDIVERSFIATELFQFGDASHAHHLLVILTDP